MYTSDVTRVTGLSGIDTDNMVKQLMSAESQKLYRYQRNVQWKEWQQEAYRGVIKQFQEFQSTYFTSSATSNFRYSAAFQNFKSTVTDSNGNETNAITINSTTNSGKYELEVKQLAKEDSYTGSKVSGKVKSNLSTSDILDYNLNKLKAGDSVNLGINLDGTTKTISISKEEYDNLNPADREASFVDLLNNKLSTAFGTETTSNGTNAKVQVSNSSGFLEFNVTNGHTITINNQTNAGSSRNVNISSSLTDKSTLTGKEMTVAVGSTDYKITLGEVRADASDEDIAAAINNALKTAKKVGSSDTDPAVNLTSVVSASTKNGELSFTSKDSVNSVVVSGNALDSITGSSNTSIDMLPASSANMLGLSNNATNALDTKATLESFGLTGDTTLTINGESLTVTKDTNIKTLMNLLNKSKMGVDLSYNNITEKFTLKASEGGAMNKISIDDQNTKDFLNNILGIGVDSTSSNYANTTHQDAQDAVIVLDGVETTRTSNDVTINGLSITLNKETTSAITINSEYDTDATYDMISQFVEDYNSLIVSLNAKTSEARAKSDSYSYYEPLTSAEKDEMTEDEIEKWEAKAKTGLLYRDSTISTLLSKMRSAMYQSVDLGNGSSIALYNIGITTSSDFTENGKLVIDEEKLRKAIKENGDDIITLFTQSEKGLSDTLNSIINGGVGTNGSLRAKAGIEGTSSENENSFSKQIKELNEKISAEKKRLYDKENHYYSMFSSMESAVNNSNSQLDALYAMLG